MCFYFLDLNAGVSTSFALVPVSWFHFGLPKTRSYLESATIHIIAGSLSAPKRLLAGSNILECSLFLSHPGREPLSEAKSVIGRLERAGYANPEELDGVSER